jgi:hypothetical protein
VAGLPPGFTSVGNGVYLTPYGNQAIVQDGMFVDTTTGQSVAPANGVSAFTDPGSPAASAAPPAAPASSPIAAAQPTPAQLQSLQPQMFQAFGSIPTAAPATVNAAQVANDPNTLASTLKQYTGLESQALAPTFQQQQQQLDENLGARGIFNSGAGAYAEGNLLSGQAATLASSIAPLVSQGYGFGQSNAQLNANLQQGANTTNAGAANNANMMSAQDYYNSVLGNQQTYNNYLAALGGAGTSYANNLTGGYFGTFDTGNPTVLGTFANGATSAGNSYNSVYNSATNADNAFMQSAGQLGGAAAGAAAGGF